ncbi:MAG: response regulator transcription factor [Acidobacteriota bacterium]|nr:response regulator transcription factor [Acidobacteriota bacterium]
MEANDKKVLIVEDDRAMAVGLRDGVASEGYRVLYAEDGAAGLDLARDEKPDIIILDVMLPKKNGLDVCRELRASGDNVPIIMLTARGQEIDKVLGLKLGADDYMTKPFSLLELLARIESVLRRSNGSGGSAEPERSTYGFGDVTLDFTRHEALKGNCKMDLSPREFMMLEFFVSHRGEVVTRDQLLDAVWGYDHIPFTRTVDAHIAKLRKKIETVPADPQYLITVHRLGYKFTG